MKTEVLFIVAVIIIAISVVVRDEWWMSLAAVCVGIGLLIFRRPRENWN